jgi:hypothetical protein
MINGVSVVTAYGGRGAHYFLETHGENHKTLSVEIPDKSTKAIAAGLRKLADRMEEND